MFKKLSRIRDELRFMFRTSGKTLNHQPGVRKAVVNYASAMATVEYDLQNCSPETLQQAVQAAGYDLLIKQDENMPDEVEQAHDKSIAH